jgi:hypothetical protein
MAGQQLFMTTAHVKVTAEEEEQAVHEVCGPR